eukprot:12516394-Ditylum_brightwellii.AAC.1
MRLEKNGKGSSSKCTCCIDIHYFFVMDCIEAGDLTIEYCPAGMMLGDFYTKPLQGKAFCAFCDLVLNIEGMLPKESTQIEVTPPKKNLSDIRLPTCLTLQECDGQIMIKNNIRGKCSTRADSSTATKMRKYQSMVK